MQVGVQDGLIFIESRLAADPRCSTDAGSVGGARRACVMIDSTIRAAAIPVHNDRTLELFTRRVRPRTYELWCVASVERRRMVIHHYLTRDHLEARLTYARKNDIRWRDATMSEVPRRVSTLGLVMGTTLPPDSIVNHELLVLHLPVPCLPANAAASAAARRSIVGVWSDGKVQATFGPQDRLRLSHRVPSGHPFRNVAGCPVPDRWGFASWQLSLINAKQQCGLRRSVLRVDHTELHLAQAHNAVDPNMVAHVFRRVDA